MNKRIGVNVFFSLLQAVLTGLLYYFFYKYLIKNIGTEEMGVWALVLSVSATANVANMGIGSGVIRFTAKFKENRNLVLINNLVHTSSIIIFIFLLVTSFLVLLVAPAWMNAVVQEKYMITRATSLFPFTLMALVINGLASVFLSCIDGLQKNYIKSIIYITANVFLLVFTVLLVPLYGIFGIVYAQIIQASTLFILGMFSLKLLFREFKFFPVIWDKTIVKSILSFGAKEQVISISQLFHEPVTKSFLGTYGGLQLVSYYEVANKLILQLRGILISANQVFIPIFSGAVEQSVQNMSKAYKKIFSVNLFIAFIWGTILLASIIPVSHFLLGNKNIPFMVVSVFLILAYFANIITTPAYFSNIGSGRLNDNVISNIIISVLNLILCFLFGYLGGGYGVVGGWAIALAAGSLYVMFRYHRHYCIEGSLIFFVKYKTIAALYIGYLTSCILIFSFFPGMNRWLMLVINLALLLFVTMFAFFYYPEKDKFTKYIKQIKAK